MRLPLLKSIIPLVLFFILFWGCFKALQHSSIYYNTLGKISKNYIRDENRDIKKAGVPFVALADSTVLVWDANYYHEIKEHGYRRIAAKENNCIFAFFPFFPMVWKITGFSPVGMVFFNFLLFAIGFFLLFKLFQTHSQKYTISFLLLSLPFMVIFFIPYTEALYYLLFICAAWGFVKKKYWLYFISMTLAAMTRNALTLIVTAIICTEIIFLLQERKIAKSLKRLLWMTLPLLLGTIIVVIIQFLQGSNSIFNFLSAQSYWGHRFSLSNFSKIFDWSHEGFGMNIPTFMMVTIPALVYVIILFLKCCGIWKIKSSSFAVNVENKENYLWVLCLFACLASSFMVIFFQGSNLHGLSRYVLASPNLSIALYLGFRYVKNISLWKRNVCWIICVILSPVIIFTSSYCSSFSFSFLGLLIFSTTMGLYTMQDKAHKPVYKGFLFLNFMINIIWTTYLFNMYLSNGWNFA